MLVVLHITFSFSFHFRTFFASSLWLLSAVPCYVLMNPAHIFPFSFSLLLRLCCRICVVVLLICSVLSACTRLPTPCLRWQLLFRYHNLSINLCFTMISLVSGYTSNGNAKCRLGSRSDMRLFPPLTPVMSLMFTRPYLERPVA
jgi:hypothetical protein